MLYYIYLDFMMDTFRHKGLRANLVKELKTKGIKHKGVLQAINTVPRHLFLDNAFADWAYKDQAFQIACDQTISQPYTVARQTELLDPQKSDLVLEIGTGSGYQASILSLLVKKVYSIERQRLLFEQTSKLLERLGFGKIRTLYGDGYLGAPRFAPFDKILITAAASEVPQVLLDQLKIGGYMVIPIGDGSVQTMTRIKRISEDAYETEEFGKYQFVPFISGVNNR